MTEDNLPLIRRNIYNVLREYFGFLQSDFAFAQQQKSELWGMHAHNKRALGMKLRDHIAVGRVYMCHVQPSDRIWSQSIHENPEVNCFGSLVKIGYTTFLAQERVKQLARNCGYESYKLVSTFPSEDDAPVGFVHLLEKIIHELCARRQVDIYCHACGMTHVEFFMFEDIGDRDRSDSLNMHIGRLHLDIARWIDALVKAWDLFKMVVDIQELRLQRIKKSLMHTTYDAPW
ncbi:hypothetical protein BG000_008272 [Podila horticola]|nr:hypothetical protein BG000_008272 [Podila horticola]